MHTNNIHTSYNFDLLCKENTALSEFVFVNKHQIKTIDFSNPKAVKTLNTALLNSHYQIKKWEFPDSNLCPPIPSRVDYIHYLKDVIGNTPNAKILDIGTGATCIYPLLGTSVYNWQFVGCDIDNRSLKIAKAIITENNLEPKIELRLQENSDAILKGIIKPNEKFTASICNPPFYKSKAEAQGANSRKLKGLNQNTDSKVRNFSGNQNELWYRGGEKAFLHTYLYESTFFKDQITWFTSLVSKKENVKSMLESFKKLGVCKHKVIPMEHGNKITRIIAWSFN